MNKFALDQFKKMLLQIDIGLYNKLKNHLFSNF